MTAFDRLTENIKTTTANEAEVVKLHVQVWETGMMLSGPQFKEIIEKIKTFENISPYVYALTKLSEGYYCTFYPAHGNSDRFLDEAIELFVKLGNKGGIGSAQSFKVIYYKNNGQLDKAQELVQQAIENIGNEPMYQQSLCICYYQAGEMNHLLRDYTTAINYFSEGLKIANHTSAVYARLLVGLACVYKDTNEDEKALDFFERTLKHIEGKNNYILESKVHADLGNFYFRKNDYVKAIQYQHKSIDIRKKLEMKNGLITNYLELAEICVKQNQLEEALEYALVTEQLATELNVVIKLCQVYQITSTIYEQQNNLPLALMYYKKYHQTKEIVFSQENTRKMKQLTMQHEMENVQNEKELFRLRNVVLKEALEEIEASVRYAQRIQQAILPPVELIKENLPHSFVLYKPKDIVAGDFYWMEKIGGTLFIAAADCTGHGVPGAMVSVVCSNALNRAVKEFDLTDPGKILDKVTDLVLETFEKSTDDVKDGMDISLLSINKVSKQIQWSGANNPLWYFDNDALKEITADKQPIGKSDHRKDFTTHTIEYKPNLTFYLFTDGYADQFGGPKGKKFKYKQLQEIIALNLHKEPTEQQQELSTVFNNWKGELEQIDDVCIIGIKF